MKFTDLGLSNKVLEAVHAAGFTEPTPIQAKTIPIALEGRDVVGIAQTGTGKTASFVLPMLTKLERGRARARMPRSLILEPTRELAAQVAEAFEQLGKKHKLTVALLIGGVSFDEQFRKLDRGADVLIATPGRLLDHFGRGKLLLTAVEVFVIDEADRMLDMGFIPDVERICGLLSPARQTLFFSATMPPEIEKLTHKFLNAPEQVSVDSKSMAASTIQQRLKAISPEPKAKRAALRDLMREEDVKNAIIFCNRKRDVGTVYRSLKKHGFNAGELHGDMDQRQRTLTLDGFRNGDITFLVASDVAARGLDIPEVSHVFNYDVPTHAEDYIHRIGRTGRAGREGYAATLVTDKEMPALREIEKLLGGQVEWLGERPSGGEDEDAGRGRRRSGSGRRRGGKAARGGEAEDRQVQQPKPDARAKADESDGDGKGGRQRGRRAGRRQKSEAAPEQPAADTAPTRDQAHKDAGNNGADEQQQKPRKRGRKRELEAADADASGSTAFGMSDQVPAFLKRPIRRAATED